MKKILSFVAAVIVLTTTGLAASTKTVQEYYKENRKVLTGYEEMLAVAQSGYKVGGKYFTISDDKSKTELDITNIETPDGFGLDITTAAKFIFAALTSGKSPAEFADYDVVKYLTEHQGADGSFNYYVSTHCSVMLALDAVQATYNEEKAIDYIEASQYSNGGWGYEYDGVTYYDIDTTAMVIIVLLDKVGTETIVQNAINFLKTQVQSDGSFASNASSTAMALMALIDAGVDIDHSTEFSKTPSSLEQFKNSDGSYRWMTTQTAAFNAFATPQTFLALEAYKNGKSAYKLLSSGGTFAFALENPVTVPEASSQSTETSQSKDQNPDTGDTALYIAAFLAIISLSFILLNKKLGKR